jgi:GT2 family glycosyltransferase
VQTIKLYNFAAMVSAIILSYNRCAEVIYTIEQLTNNTAHVPFDFEIIVVDNNSHDDTVAQVSAKFPQVNLLRLFTNKGIAGWNEGFKVAKYKYMLVLDDDSHLESGLEEAVTYLEQHHDVGILALNIEGGSFETDLWEESKDLIGFIGCGAIIRKEVFEKIGGFAEWLMVYTHEWEYGIRCIEAGYRIRYFSGAKIIHRASKINRTSKRVRVYTTRNELAIVYKYFKTHKAKYLFRVWVNNIKVFKAKGLLAGYYSVLGGLEFLKLRKHLPLKPVSEKTQNYFAKKYWSTQSIFSFLRKYKKGGALKS